jgi:uncharacterized protein (TIGR02217 family)
MTGFLTGVRLPEDVERGALGGARFNTSILELDSGFEKRNQNWATPIGEWDVGFGLLLKFQEDPLSMKLDLDDLINFFYIVRGAAQSFRFKDWSDFEIGYQNGVAVDAQLLGLGDDITTQFQIFKRYSYAGFTFDRVLTKLAQDGSLQVFLDGILQTITTHYTVDEDRGLINMVTAPASTGGTGPGGEELLTFRTNFDVHARLDSDDLKVNMEIFNAGSWPNVPIRELRGNGID